MVLVQGIGLIFNPFEYIEVQYLKSKHGIKILS